LGTELEQITNEVLDAKIMLDAKHADLKAVEDKLAEVDA